jgi:hypothetical protein
VSRASGVRVGGHELGVCKMKQHVKMKSLGSCRVSSAGELRVWVLPR